MILTKTEGVQRLEKFVLETSVKHRNIGLKVTKFVLINTLGTLIFLIIL